MNMADRIQALRKSKGISQEEFADKLGVSRQAVSKWESEQSVPELDKIISMSDYFEVTTDYILKGIESTSTPGRHTLDILNAGFALAFATAAGLWSFTANRFRMDECLFISLAGAVIGLGVSLIFQMGIRLFKKQ